MEKNNNIRHKPQPAKTLMRSAVHKPGSSLKRNIKAVGAHSAGVAKNSIGAALTKHSVHQLDSQRLQHANHVKKSAMVSRFGAVDPQPYSPAVSAAPSRTPVAEFHRPSASKPHVSKHPQTTAELLQHALELASSHEQPAVKHHSRSFARRVASKRITGVSALVVAAFLLVGAVAYSNSTAVRMHVASSHAGFTASMPSFQPAGFHLSHLDYRPGNVAIQFASNSDDRTYAVTEQPSEWDSQTLRDDFVSTAGQDYQAVETAGSTLYLYGKNDATWVSGGVWYQVKSSGALSAHQLVELASSL